MKEYVANACHKAGVTNRVALASWYTEHRRDSA